MQNEQGEIVDSYIPRKWWVLIRVTLAVRPVKRLRYQLYIKLYVFVSVNVIGEKLAVSSYTSVSDFTMDGLA